MYSTRNNRLLSKCLKSIHIALVIAYISSNSINERNFECILTIFLFYFVCIFIFPLKIESK